jgi:hypothetical protein
VSVSRMKKNPVLKGRMHWANLVVKMAFVEAKLFQPTLAFSWTQPTLRVRGIVAA